MGELTTSWESRNSARQGHVSAHYGKRLDSLLGVFQLSFQHCAVLPHLCHLGDHENRGDLAPVACEWAAPRPEHLGRAVLVVVVPKKVQSFNGLQRCHRAKGCRCRGSERRTMGPMERCLVQTRWEGRVDSLSKWPSCVCVCCCFIFFGGGNGKVPRTGAHRRSPRPAGQRPPPSAAGSTARARRPYS